MPVSVSVSRFGATFSETFLETEKASEQDGRWKLTDCQKENRMLKSL